MQCCEICSERNIILDKHHIISRSKGGSNPFQCPECKRRTNSEKKFVAHLTQHHDWSAAAAMNLANQIIIDIELFF